MMMIGGGAGAAHMKVVHLFEEAPRALVEAYPLAGPLLPMIKALPNLALLNDLLLLGVLHPVGVVLVLAMHLHTLQMRTSRNAFGSVSPESVRYGYHV